MRNCRVARCWAVALATLVVCVASPQIVRSKAEIGIIGWRPNGKLLYHLAGKLKEWPSGRTAQLPKPPTSFAGVVHECLQEPGKDNWLINDRIFDARTFKFGASVPREAENSAFWADGSVGYLLTSVDQKLNETSWIVHKGEKRRLDGGWCYQAISEDGQFLSATREPLFVDNDLYILRLDLETGLVKPIRKYPKAVDDHLSPSAPDWNPTVGSFLIVLWTPGTGYTVVARKTLERILTDMNEVISSWVSPKSPLFLSYNRWDSGKYVGGKETRYPAKFWEHTSLTLQDARTGRRTTLASARQNFVWTGRDLETKILAGSTQIKDYALDFARRRLAYVVTHEEASSTGDAKYSDTRPKTDRLYVRSIARRLP